MNVNDYLRGIAGTFIVLSLVLSRVHSEYWLLFTVFIGLNLLQSACSKWCPMMSILRYAGVKDSYEKEGKCC